jgi:RNA polymerase sigma factor (sigma-70 family)
MMHSEIPWQTLTEQLYEARLRAINRTTPAVDEFEEARLWTEVARRVKLIARKGFRRTIPAYDLEDIEQRVLIKLLSPDILRSAVSSSSPGIYIARVITNETLDFMRKRVRDSFMGGEIHENSRTTSSDLEFQNARVRELFTRLEQELDALHAADRALLTRKFWSGMDITEIAEEMHLPYSTVAKRLFRAIAKLRQRLDPNT